MQHEEDYASDTSKDAQYFEGYADLGVHKVMLRDRPRMDFYRTLLTDRSVVEGKVIVDVGSGSGILTCWAAKSGAAHVLSIEASSLAEVQRHVVAENGLADRVTVIAATVEELIADGVDAFVAAHPCVRRHGGVALVVSEWMGFYLLHECMLPSVLRARDFLRAVNATLASPPLALRMLPSRGRLLAAPITLAPYYADTFAAFWGCVDGIRLDALGRLEYEAHIAATSPLVDVLPSRCLLHAGEVFWDGNLDTLSVDELTSIAATRSFDFAAATTDSAAACLRDGGCIVVDGFAVWFDVSYGAAVLDTSPRAPPTHWKQTTLLLPREFRDGQVVSFDGLDERLELRLQLTAEDLTHRCYKMEFELN
ncbi:arginine N-methyltransferase, type I [Novymonas esmeraldas]|uniref:Arginine N-methyltransferase, type I n=1 Tax=Novymonas esmeraldas TaxID=1808958 RepID=A0AAW0EZ46_9TRYP